MNKICPMCNKDYETKREKQKYCSVICKNTSQIHVEEKQSICKNCKTNFSFKYWNNAGFCSKGCYHEYTKKYDIKYICKNCGEEIISKYKKRIFCSKLCRDNWSKSKEGRKQAGMHMLGKISSKRGTTLSEEIKNKISESTKKAMKAAMDSKGERWRPFFNKVAAEYFVKYDEENNTTGQHALNGGERRIYNRGNIFIDYINDSLKIIIEYDESHHKYKQDYDSNRENRIRELLPEYKIIRIDDRLVKSYEDFVKMVNL